MSERTNKHFRELPSVPFAETKMPPEFEHFFRVRILPKLSFEGYKVAEKQRIAAHAIHNLILTGMTKAVVADSRDKNKKMELRAKVWDVIVEAGFARMSLGSENVGMQTRYRATSSLLRLREEWELRLMIDLTLERNTELDEPTHQALVVLHTGKVDLATGEPLPEERRRQPIQFREKIGELVPRGIDGQPEPQAVENAVGYFRAMEDVIEKINRENLAHSWQAFAKLDDGRTRAFQPNPCLRQVHVGKFFRAVRLYSWSQWSGQNLSKDVRQGMLIDAEPVAELDFSGMAPRLLYHLNRINVKGDVYRPEKVFRNFYGFENTTEAQKELVRDFVKRVTNICLNVDSKKRAIGAVRGLLENHPQRKTLMKMIEKTESTSVTGIIDRIYKTHERVQHAFFSEIGMELMSTDGKIMIRILSDFAAAAKPALGIHDAVVCRASDAKFAQKAMHSAYRAFIQFDPVIKRTF